MDAKFVALSGNTLTFTISALFLVIIAFLFFYIYHVLSSTAPPPTLDYLGLIDLNISPTDFGTTPFGGRMVVDILGGTIEGPKLTGTVLSTGGDWALATPDGILHLECRITIKTNDEKPAFIYVNYRGKLIFGETEQKILGGAIPPVDFGVSKSLFMTPFFETSDNRYTWLNQVVAVGQGRLLPGKVQYRLYVLSNGQHSVKDDL